MSKIIGYKMVGQDLVPINAGSSEYELQEDSGASSSNLKNFWEIDTADLLFTSLSVEIRMSTFFNAIHKVALSHGRDGEIHQHSYHLKVRARGYDRQNKVITPFADVRYILDKVSSIYEGKVLNKLPPFANMQPTTEIFAAVLAHQIKNLAAKIAIEIIEVTLFESPTTGITIVLNHA